MLASSAGRGCTSTCPLRPGVEGGPLLRQTSQLASDPPQPPPAAQPQEPQTPAAGSGPLTSRPCRDRIGIGTMRRLDRMRFLAQRRTCFSAGAFWRSRGSAGSTWRAMRLTPRRSLRSARASGGGGSRWRSWCVTWRPLVPTARWTTPRRRCSQGRLGRSCCCASANRPAVRPQLAGCSARSPPTSLTGWPRSA